MEKLLKVFEHNPTNGMDRKIVSSQSRHKKLSPIALKQASENKKIQTETAKTKMHNVKSKLEKKVDVNGQKSPTCIRKISRPCRADIKENSKNDKTGENKAISDEKTNKFAKPTKDEFYKFYKNLLAFDAVPDSDSLESDYDEERGFTTADRFLMLNQLSKELERREHVIKDVKKQKCDELLKKQKSESDIDIEFAAHDDEINKIIKTFFRNSEHKNSLQNIPTEIHQETISTKKVSDVLKKENSLESDDSYDADNLELEVQKLMESLDKRVKDYNVKNTEFEQYFDPFEGITDQKLHNYFLKKVMTGKEENSTNAALQDKHNVIDEADKSIDVLHQLSTEEKRQKLQKLLNDLKSNPFLQGKSLGKVGNVSKTIPFGTEQSDKYLKKLSTKEILTKQVMVPLLDQSDKIMDRTKEYDEEFHIMFSDISTEEEEDEEEQKKEVGDNERKVEKKQGITKQIGFKKTFSLAMKHMKDSSKSESSTKTGMQRLIKRYKRKQQEEEHRKREFVRWFGESSTKDYIQQERADVPGWKPGWHKLDSHLKDGMLKNGRDGNLRLKKGQENDPIEEYRRLLKEYEQLEGKVKLIEGQNDKQSRDQNIHNGEKWIKIKKGTLMKDYQIRWRQGMYYLVERKHIKKQTKQRLSKKRMIRASSDTSRSGKQLEDKNTGKLNIKRALAKKKGSKMVKVKRKSFRKRGEATKEIRRILSRLASKHVDKGDEDLIDQNKMKLNWTTAKFNDYFKKKCQEFDIKASTTERNNIRKSFSHYCFQYFVAKLQRKETQLKKQQEDMYPLGLFKPKEPINGDLEYILEEELSDESDIACSDEDEIFNEALIQELFSFWMTDLQTSERYDEELQIFETRRGKRNTQSDKEILGKQLRFLTESPKKTLRNNSTNGAEQSPPQHCKDLFDLSPDLRDRFFGSEASVSSTQLKIPFGDKYLTKDKSYLGDMSIQSGSAKYSEVISEMKQEGLIEIVDYQFLKDDEAIFPWDEIEIVLMEHPAYKEYIFKKEEQPSLIKDEHVCEEEEDSWSESDDLGLS